MRRTIHAVVSHITDSILSNSAYPVAEKEKFEAYHQDEFVKCTKHLKYFKIVKCIQCDDELVKLGTCVVNILIVFNWQFFLFC